jgi:8-oxo-dGTP diphosphatase
MPRPDNVGVGVALTIVDFKENKILLLKRKGAHANGTWACPGGWVDFEDESPEITVSREAWEEVGINFWLEDLKLLTVVSELHEELSTRSVTVYYLLDYANVTGFFEGLEPVIREPNKASDLKWWDIDNPPDNMFPKLWQALACIKDLS